jgi:hypothetical protein
LDLYGLGISSFSQKGKTEYAGFIPARVANRQQLQSIMSNQQGKIDEVF